MTTAQSICDDDNYALKAFEARARRAARRVGLLAIKSRKFRGTIDNLGGFQIIHPATNSIVAGERLDLSSQEVIDFCESYSAKQGSQL